MNSKFEELRGWRTLLESCCVQGIELVMGVGVQWRRVTEGAMQRLHLTDKNFVPTSNERNEKMLREAAAFDAHLKRLEGSIKEAKGASEGEQRHT